MGPDFAQNAAFHNQQASSYDTHLAANRHNHLARCAFHDVVDSLVPAGGILLDFGCGTGIDAQLYARRGYRVLAYDNSPGMVEQLQRRCAGEIAAGQVRACAFDYGQFPARLPEWPAVNGIVANFAVLNSIRDLTPLFESFARLLAPPGIVVVSVLNPLHWSKVKMPAWWRKAWRDWGGPRLYTERPYASYLHFVPAMARAAQDFELLGRANAGAAVRYEELGGEGVSRYWGEAGPAWQTPAYRLLGHFLFLVWRRK